MMIRLVTTYACGAIFVDNDLKIIDAAPIFRKMIGQNLKDVISKLKAKKQYIELTSVNE